MRIKITADSTCDLSEELLREYDIDVIPLYINRGHESLRDGVDIRPKDIFHHVKQGGELCSTSAVNFADYMGIFGRWRKEYDAIIHFCISSDMSACYHTACLAAAEIGGVYPIDSRNLSTGIGYMAIEAALMAKSGMEPDEILKKLDTLIKKMEVSFVIETVDYLHKGGRCGTIAAIGANLLKIKPCIEVKQGKMAVGKKYRGTFEKSLLSYVSDRLGGREDLDQRRIFVTHSCYDRELLDRVIEQVKASGSWERVLETEVGGTVACHCGPNCLGLLFARK